MTPLDWGITAAAALMLLYAARTFVSGKGKSQMGASFAFVAALVWTLALGRHLDGFSFLDGFRVAIGVLLLVPVLRVAFSHTGGSIVFAVMSLILASVIAGPVVGRFAGQLSPGGAPRVESIESTIADLDTEIELQSETRKRVAGFLVEERDKLQATGLKTAAEIDANPEAFDTLRRYARYKQEHQNLSEVIAQLEQRKDELERTLVLMESGTSSEIASKTDAQRIKELVEADIAREQPVLEKFSERGEVLELFESEFGDAQD
ncbi:MAG: hypothetical protein AAGI22_07090 [Planctomycetota bacterium]